jgi:hypothetical protein
MYTNEVSPEYLRSLNTPDFTEQQIAQFAEQSQAVVRQQESFIKAHPTIAIFRFATEGSQTRDGGVTSEVQCRWTSHWKMVGLYASRTKAITPFMPMAERRRS